MTYELSCGHSYVLLAKFCAKDIPDKEDKRNCLAKLGGGTRCKQTKGRAEAPKNKLGQLSHRENESLVTCDILAARAGAFGTIQMT
eukprot:5888126-Amphidinium_carterae.1